MKRAVVLNDIAYDLNIQRVYFSTRRTALPSQRQLPRPSSIQIKCHQDSAHRHPLKRSGRKDYDTKIVWGLHPQILLQTVYSRWVQFSAFDSWGYRHHYKNADERNPCTVWSAAGAICKRNWSMPIQNMPSPAGLYPGRPLPVPVYRTVTILWVWLWGPLNRPELLVWGFLNPVCRNRKQTPLYPGEVAEPIVIYGTTRRKLRVCNWFLHDING